MPMRPAHERPRPMVAPDLDTASKVDTWDSLREQMLATASQTIDFYADRPEGEDPDLTFSTDVFDNMKAAMALWMGTRAIRHIEAGKPGPKKMQLTLTVRLDDEPLQRLPDEQRPFFVMDGTHRQAATNMDAT